MRQDIGGSTEEAQEAIGYEVSGVLINLINQGATLGSVNFPAISLPYGGPGTHRILNIHHNRPGVMRDVNTKISDFNVSCLNLIVSNELWTSEGRWSNFGN